jgi:hypothetical protein
MGKLTVIEEILLCGGSPTGSAGGLSGFGLFFSRRPTLRIAGSGFALTGLAVCNRRRGQHDLAAAFRWYMRSRSAISASSAS